MTHESFTLNRRTLLSFCFFATTLISTHSFAQEKQCGAVFSSVETGIGISDQFALTTTRREVSLCYQSDGETQTLVGRVIRSRAIDDFTKTDFVDLKLSNSRQTVRLLTKNIESRSVELLDQEPVYPQIDLSKPLSQIAIADGISGLVHVTSLEIFEKIVASGGLRVGTGGTIFPAHAEVGAYLQLIDRTPEAIRLNIRATSAVLVFTTNLLNRNDYLANRGWREGTHGAYTSLPSDPVEMHEILFDIGSKFEPNNEVVFSHDVPLDRNLAAILVPKSLVPHYQNFLEANGFSMERANSLVNPIEDLLK